MKFEPQIQASVIVNTAMARVGDLENSEKSAFESVTFMDSNPGKAQE
jgi:hypothetical protein